MRPIGSIPRRRAVRAAVALIVFGALTSAAITLAPTRSAPRGLPKTGGAMKGTPTTGARGVRLTTTEIAARQARAPKSSRALSRARGASIVGVRPIKPERVLPGRESRPQDPAARELAQWPPLPPSREPAKPSAPQTIDANFDAVTGPTETQNAFPPDTMGAVGPSQFFLFVNGRLRTFSKATGTADGVVNADPDVFFASVMTPVSGGSLNVNFTSDPQIRYDRLTARWIMIIIDVPSKDAVADTPNRILIAVSDAASAGVITGSTVWTLYFVQQDTVGPVASTNEFLDYPSLGVDANALYIGGNMFGATSGNFVTTSAFVIRKSSVLSGGPVVTTAFRGLIPNPNTDDGPLTPRGVDNVDPAATEGYFIGVSNAAFSRLILRRIADPGGTPTISADIPFTTPITTSFPITVDHLGDTGGTSGNVDALDDRLFQAQIRNGRLWTAHNIAVTATGVASNSNAQRRDAVRWYEVIVPPGSGTPTFNQSGTIFDTAATVAAARQYSIPSVAVTGQGHAALGYTTGGTPFRLDAATNGRLVGDTLGTLGTVNIYTASSTAYNPPLDPGGTFGRRWGDYSFTSLDPLDDMTLWTVQEYNNGTNTYGARVAELLAPPPADPTSASPSSIAPGIPSITVTITGTQVAGSGFYDPGPNLSAPALPFNHITGSVTGGITVNSASYTSPTQMKLNISTVGASAGPQDVTVTNPDGQSKTGVGLITIGGPTAVRTASVFARTTKKGVVVRWRTTSETGVAGFNVYRGSVRLNRRVISAAGTTRGHSYSWLDQARPVKGRTYRIQAVRTNGSRAWIGSARS